jgi:hypothetical protein
MVSVCLPGIGSRHAILVRRTNKGGKMKAALKYQHRIKWIKALDKRAFDAYYVY